MNRYERQVLARAMRMAGDCFVVANTPYTLEDPGEEVDNIALLLDLMQLLRLTLQYKQFDLEATRRERDQVQHGSGGQDNEGLD